MPPDMKRIGLSLVKYRYMCVFRSPTALHGMTGVQAQQVSLSILALSTPSNAHCYGPALPLASPVTYRQCAEG